MKRVAVLLFPLFAATARGETLSGSWSSPFGALALSQKGDEVVGTGSGSKCPAPASGHVLEGDMLEDSLSGQLYLCFDGCAKTASWVPVLLLVGGDGKTLSGTSTLPKGCKAQVGPNGSLILKRQAAGMAKASTPKPAPPPTIAPPTTPSPTEPATDNSATAEVPSSSNSTAKTPPAKPKHHPAPAAPAPTVAEPEPREREAPREDPQARAKALEIARDGAAFQQEGKFEQARKRFQEAIAVDPYYAEGFNGVGVTFFARNDLSEALRWYKKALGADPSFGDAYYNMACVYAVQKRRALALRYLKIAFHNGYTSRETMRDDADLSSLHGDPKFEALMREEQ